MLSQTFAINMSLLEVVFMIGGGLYLLTCAADWLVAGASALARRMGVSPLVVGLTVVAFGTSMPEMVVSVDASFNNNPGISVGNVVGSNIFNAALILGIAALICPIKCSKSVIRRDVPIMIGTALMFWGMARDQMITRVEGGICLGLMVAYTVISYYLAIRDPNPEIPPEAQGELTSTLKGDIFRILAGLLGLVGGAKLLLIGSVTVAKSLGVSDEVIGLTLIAAGTSLPELATSIVAALNNQSDIAIGNVVGSNIFNVLGILGVAGSILPLKVSEHMYGIDIPVMVVVSLGCLPIMRSGYQISRAEGALLTAVYIGYTYILFLAPG